MPFWQPRRIFACPQGRLCCPWDLFLGSGVALGSIFGIIFGHILEPCPLPFCRQTCLEARLARLWVPCLSGRHEGFLLTLRILYNFGGPVLKLLGTFLQVLEVVLSSLFGFPSHSPSVAEKRICLALVSPASLPRVVFYICHVERILAIVAMSPCNVFDLWVQWDRAGSPHTQRPKASMDVSSTHNVGRVSMSKSNCRGARTFAASNPEWLSVRPKCRQGFQ